jgi:PAS domain S-box-containing protein
MSAPDSIVAAATLAGGGTVVLLAGVCLVLLAALVVIWVTSATTRRRRASEVREIVRTIEEIRGGRQPQPAQVDSASPLAIVADAVHRLAHESGHRSRSVEASRARLRAMTEVLDDAAVITTDMDGDVTRFSRGATVLFGLAESEISGRPASTLFEPEAYREFLPAMARKSVREQGLRTRTRMLARDGKPFDAELMVRALPASGSHGAGFLLVVRDATPTVALEHALKESEGRYRHLVEGLVDGIGVVIDGRLAFVNPALARLLGADPASVTGRSLREFVATADLLVAEEHLSSIVSGDVAECRFAARLVDESGTALADVRVHARPIEQGERHGALLLIRDETAARRIESELRSNEARLDAVLESSADGLLVLSGSPGRGRVRMTNRAFGRMFGVEPESLLGLDERALAARLADGGGAGAGAARLLEESGSVERVGTLRAEGDPPREYELSIRETRDRHGQPLGRIVACRDLTDRRKSELELQAFVEEMQLGRTELEQSHRRLRKLYEDLEQRSAKLAALNSELRTISEMKSDLLGNVAHELQTPLVAIRGYTEMIHKGRLGPISEEQRRGLATALTNIDRLISMIDGLLTFSRQEEAIGELSLSRFALGPLVREVAELLREKYAQAGVVLEQHIDDSLEVYADRDKLHQVFVNLLSNASKFNSPGGRATVTARRGPDDRANVRVEDDGIGISREDLGRIFDRHFRAEDEDVEKVAGSGIGLAIVRDILRLHGSRIHVESEQGRGTVFSFGLPTSGPGGHDDGDPERHEPGTPGEDPAGPGGGRSAGPESPDTNVSEARHRFRVLRAGPAEDGESAD